MDWRSVKFDWNRARAFLVTAEEGSLSAAARALGMSQPTLGRQVDALEEELGVVLFERAGRGLMLTPSGLELLDHVRAMGAAAGRVSLAASGQAQAIEGSIVITASEIEAAYLLPPIVEKLRVAEPGIRIELVATNAAVDLRRREADIALRSFRPEQPDLIARKIREDAAYFYASRRYLDRVGGAVTLDNLHRAEFIGFPGVAFVEGIRQRGLPITEDNITVLTANHLVHWEMARSGVAIGMAPQSIGDADPGMRRVLDEAMQPFVFPLWLTTHRELNTSRRVRLVFDFLAQALAK